MYNFTKTLITGKNITPGENSCKYIIWHHTWSSNTTGDVSVLSGNTSRPVSVHFLIGEGGESYKLADPKSICRHAWESQRGTDKDLNKMSLGIEITGSTAFDNDQFIEAVRLTRYLMRTFLIPKENVLTHASVTREGSKDKKLRDGQSSSRKVDPNRSLWAARGYQSFEQMRDFLLT